MELKILNQAELDNFVAGQPNSQILQRFAWGEFQKSVGRRVWRFGVLENNDLLASAQIIGHPLKLKKSYLYCPRGPLVKQTLTPDKQTQILKLILSKARDLTIQTAQSEEIFFRIEPTFPLQPSAFGLRSTKSVQPAKTLLLDLRPAPADLLKNMHPKGRYNIQLAGKQGVIIRQGKPDDFEQVWPMFQSTGQRDGFGLHPKNYYRAMLKNLAAVELWLAWSGDKIIAASLTAFYGDTATYLHGASDYDFRKLMASHWLQWQMIEAAKQRGYKYYDFHGIEPTDDPKHPWHGLTRFKKGFGGQPAAYPGTFDFIYERNWYNIYKLLRTANRLKRKQ